MLKERFQHFNLQKFILLTQLRWKKKVCTSNVKYIFIISQSDSLDVYVLSKYCRKLGGVSNTGYAENSTIYNLLQVNYSLISV